MINACTWTNKQWLLQNTFNKLNVLYVCTLYMISRRTAHARYVWTRGIVFPRKPSKPRLCVLDPVFLACVQTYRMWPIEIKSVAQVHMVHIEKQKFACKNNLHLYKPFLNKVLHCRSSAVESFSLQWPMESQHKRGQKMSRSSSSSYKMYITVHVVIFNVWCTCCLLSSLTSFCNSSTSLPS